MTIFLLSPSNPIVLFSTEHHRALPFSAPGTRPFFWYVCVQLTVRQLSCVMTTFTNNPIQTSAHGDAHISRITLTGHVPHHLPFARQTVTCAMVANMLWQVFFFFFSFIIGFVSGTTFSVLLSKVRSSISLFSLPPPPSQ